MKQKGLSLQIAYFAFGVVGGIIRKVFCIAYVLS